MQLGLLYESFGPHINDDRIYLAIANIVFGMQIKVKPSIELDILIYFMITTYIITAILGIN